MAVQIGKFICIPVVETGKRQSCVYAVRRAADFAGNESQYFRAVISWIGDFSSERQIETCGIILFYIICIFNNRTVSHLEVRYDVNG